MTGPVEYPMYQCRLCAMDIVYALGDVCTTVEQRVREPVEWRVWNVPWSALFLRLTHLS